MRTLFAGLATLGLGLATCLSALAQTENRDQDRTQSKDQPSNQGERKVIRGVIAGVTVEGEMAIDYRTHRAATAEMSYLTIVGSERPDQGRMRGEGAGRDRDRDERNANAARDRDNDRNRDERNTGDRQTLSDRHRHNIYVVWVTPKTVIRTVSDRRNERERGERDANRNDRDRDRDRDNDRNNQDANANQDGGANALTLDALEVGDRVEVRFLQRSSASDNENAPSRKHGRHRTYFGEAISINILSEPGQDDRNRDSDRQRNRDRDRDQNNNNRNKD